MPIQTAPIHRGRMLSEVPGPKDSRLVRPLRVRRQVYESLACRGSPELRGGSPAFDGNSDVQCRLPRVILDASGVWI